MLEAETSVEKQSGTKSSTTDKEAGEYLMMGGRGGQINYSLIKTEVYFSLTWNNLKKKKKKTQSRAVLPGHRHMVSSHSPVHHP